MSGHSRLTWTVYMKETEGEKISLKQRGSRGSGVLQTRGNVACRGVACWAERGRAFNHLLGVPHAASLTRLLAVHTLLPPRSAHGSCPSTPWSFFNFTAMGREHACYSLSNSAKLRLKRTRAKSGVVVDGYGRSRLLLPSTAKIWIL